MTTAVKSNWPYCSPIIGLNLICYKQANYNWIISQLNYFYSPRAFCLNLLWLQITTEGVAQSGMIVSSPAFWECHNNRGVNNDPALLQFFRLFLNRYYTLLFRIIKTGMDFSVQSSGSSRLAWPSRCSSRTWTRRANAADFWCPASGLLDAGTWGKCGP